jgi:ribosomal protein S18 acetylase RimI-like enzyme
MKNQSSSAICYKLLTLDDHTSIERIKELVWEYFEWGNIMLKKHYGYELNIKEMMDTFISELPFYCLIDTRLYLVFHNKTIIGLGGFKKKGSRDVELKRIYLQEEFRGNGIGKTLISNLISDARKLEYAKMYLESADFMQKAYSLYQLFGFNKIQNYEGIETPKDYAANIYCMELKL